MLEQSLICPICFTIIKIVYLQCEFNKEINTYIICKNCVSKSPFSFLKLSNIQRTFNVPENSLSWLEKIAQRQ